jgi:hypothetical protein
MLSRFKKLTPYFIAIVLFIALSVTYFSPVLQGKHLPQLDNTHAIGMAKELVDYEAETGDKAMWTNSMFSGMPAYQIKGDASNNVYGYINRISRMGLPYNTVAILFLYLLGFYLLLLSLRLDPWLSLVGALAFGFGSYNLIIIIAGHITKTYAIALMAPVVAGILWAYNRNKWVGGLITAIALGLEIAYNHVQITYYILLMIVVLGVVKLVQAMLEKALKAFIQTSAVLVLAATLAILPNIANLWTTYEYGKFSIRGKSELSASEGEKEHSGLDKDYAFAWSYGKHETLTLLIPNVVGGASEALGNSEKAMSQVDDRLKEYVGQSSQYWGGRSFTSGPVYAGAIVCFLFFLGAFYYKGKERWWLIIATVISIFLAWGKNFAWFNDFMFYYFPLYSKFRTVEMALVIASFTMPVLGFLGLKTIIDKPEVIKQDTKWFLAAFGLTGGVALVLALMPTTFYSFLSPFEKEMLAAQIEKGGDQAMMYGLLEDNLIVARKTLLTADAWRTFFFVLIGSASIWFYSQGKLATRYLLGGLAILILVDMWDVDKRYLNNEHFISQRKAKQEFTKSEADAAILADKDLYHRVFSIYRDPFKEVNTSYFHKSIGGFHGAKLRRYQDVIDRYLAPNWQQMVGTLQTEGATPGDVEELMETMPVLNMLNTKYVIYHPQAQPIFNPSYMGNAWYVKGVKEVANADEAIEAIGTTDLAQRAVVEEEFSQLVAGYSNDSIDGQILINNYAPDNLVYTSTCSQDQLAVFSDIYYPKGWNAYIDGKPAEHFRVNYLLRALMVPAGEHTIVFKFEPSSVKYGQLVALLSSILVVLLIIGFGFWKWRSKS